MSAGFMVALAVSFYGGGRMSGRLTRNAGKCAKCGDVIESTHRHDFRSCSCGAIFVDGGLSYQRYGWAEDGAFINMAEWEGDE